MEFPSTGKRCSADACKQLDFLPIDCRHCLATFCKEHFQAPTHQCSKHKDNYAATKTKATSFVCSHESCTETFPIEMLCVKCKKHYCVHHRYHGCLEISDDEKATKLKIWQIPKKQFAEAKAIADQEISDKLKKSKNTAMANKVRLMRIKGSATGPKNVPMEERCYFLVYAPTTAINKHIGPSKGVYVNKNWTVGRARDAIADLLKVPNQINSTNIAKLVLFHHSTGDPICNEMDKPLAKLLETAELVDGESLILEYSNEASVDISLYK